MIQYTKESQIYRSNYRSIVAVMMSDIFTAETKTKEKDEQKPDKQNYTKTNYHHNTSDRRIQTSR